MNARRDRRVHAAACESPCMAWVATFFKWTGIVLASLIILTVAVAAWGYYDVYPREIEREREDGNWQAYYNSHACSATTCTATPVTETFFIHGNAKTVNLHLAGAQGSASGGLRITLTSPAGEAKYDRTFTGPAGQAFNDQATLAPVVGDWTVTYTYAAFYGSSMVRVTTIGRP